MNHDGTRFSHDYSFWSLVLAPAVSGAIAFFGLKLHKLRGQTEHPTETVLADHRPAPGKPHTGHAWGFLVALVVAFIVWLAVGFHFFPAGQERGHQAEQTPAATVSETVAAPTPRASGLH